MEMRRANERAHVEVEVSMESEHNFYTGITRDISAGGVFVATYDPPARGTIVELLLTLPGDTSGFHLTGVVRWTRDFDASCDGCPPGCGIQWLEISRGALEAIESFVCGRDTIYYEVA